MQDSINDTARVMGQLTDLSKQMTTDMNFAKAHDMQVTAQAVIGSMKQAEDNVLSQYGPDSAEYQQFKMSKSKSLALAQSQLHADYAKLDSERKTTMFGVMAQAQTAGEQLVGYNRQNHVNTMTAMATSVAQYQIQETQTLLGLEQLRSQVGNDITDYLASSPSYAVDLQPFLMELNEAYAAEQATKKANTQYGVLPRATGSIASPFGVK